ncbi:hypothetical protein D3C85_979240 [compost metagenome]
MDNYLNKMFVVGDSVRVVANECLHKFNIGDICVIESVNEVNYTVRGDYDYWYMVDTELEFYKEES